MLLYLVTILVNCVVVICNTGSGMFYCGSGMFIVSCNTGSDMFIVFVRVVVVYFMVSSNNKHTNTTHN